jgi:uncharacterized HAD superfamily protein
MNKMKVGVDIDGTITDYPEFFSTLIRSDIFEIHIITGRDPSWHEETISDLDKFGISKFEKIHYANDWSDKGKICVDNNIKVLFEDMDEFIASIPDSVAVFKIRNNGNFKRGMWL